MVAGTVACGVAVAVLAAVPVGALPDRAVPVAVPVTVPVTVPPAGAVAEPLPAVAEPGTLVPVVLVPRAGVAVLLLLPVTASRTVTMAFRAA